MFWRLGGGGQIRLVWFKEQHYPDDQRQILSCGIPDGEVWLLVQESESLSHSRRNLYVHTSFLRCDSPNGFVYGEQSPRTNAETLGLRPSIRLINQGIT